MLKWREHSQYDFKQSAVQPSARVPKPPSGFWHAASSSAMPLEENLKGPNFSNWQRLQLGQTPHPSVCFHHSPLRLFPSARLPACLPAVTDWTLSWVNILQRQSCALGRGAAPSETLWIAKRGHKSNCLASRRRSHTKTKPSRPLFKRTAFQVWFSASLSTSDRTVTPLEMGLARVDPGGHLHLQIGWASKRFVFSYRPPHPADSASLFCQVLHEEWARYSAFYKYQPIDLVR